MHTLSCVLLAGAAHPGRNIWGFTKLPSYQLCSSMGHVLGSLRDSSICTELLSSAQETPELNLQIVSAAVVQLGLL